VFIPGFACQHGALFLIILSAFFVITKLGLQLFF